MMAGSFNQLDGNAASRQNGDVPIYFFGVPCLPLLHMPRNTDWEWFPYTEFSPPDGVLCKFAILVETDQGPGHPQKRSEWIGTKNELHPASNVANVYWRLTGIGKMQMEAKK